MPRLRYGYEGDEWEDYSPISSCFDCTSYNGNNPACERPGKHKNLTVMFDGSPLTISTLQT